MENLKTWKFICNKFPRKKNHWFSGSIYISNHCKKNLGTVIQFYAISLRFPYLQTTNFWWYPLSLQKMFENFRISLRFSYNWHKFILLALYHQTTYSLREKCPNTEFFRSIFSCIRIRKNSVFGHFSRNYFRY